MIEIFKKYNQAGLACLPTKKDKSPMLSQNWRNGFSSEYFENAEGIGIICGEISGRLECMDFDNHFGDAKSNLGKYLNIPEVKELYERHKFPIEITMNGGYHLLYRCSKNEGNRKLARRWLEKENRPDAIIETRGEGGYFVAAPTPGYKVIRNDILNIPIISEIERAIMIDYAVSMDEYVEKTYKTEFESSERPGDIYNSKPESIEEMKSLLGIAGWKEVRDGQWRRPNKKEGISATLGKVADNVFYVFTQNGYPFDANKAYTPFQVLALLKFNGDFSRAAESLPYGKKTYLVSNEVLKESEIEKLLNKARIDLNSIPERPPIILTVVESDGATSITYKRVFTLGNFSCIIGKAKSKKTYLISMITAALLSKKGYTKKLNGNLPDNKNTVLYFDTEQGDYDCFAVISRIKTMAGTGQNLLAYNLRPFNPKERCQIIEFAFKLYGDKVGFCVIDGIADLAVGINEEEEATRVATMLLKLTKNYNCHISTVLHQNKNDNFATGHLGSAIMKKAEIIISVTKDNSNPYLSEVNCDMGRGVDFESFEFRINEDGMPEIIDKNAIIDNIANTKSNYYETEHDRNCPF